MLEEYKAVLSKVIGDGDLNTAKELISGFHKSMVKPDCVALYLEAAYHYYRGEYTLSLYYADMSFLLNGDYEPTHELLTYLTEYIGDFSAYKPTYTKDISSYNRKLRILSFEGFLPIVDYTNNVFRKYMEALGHEVIVIDVKDDKKAYSELSKVLQYHVDFSFVFNNMGMKVSNSITGENVFEKEKIPVYDYMFDHPMYFNADFDYTPSNYIVTCVDKNHVKYVKRFYPKVKECFFLPLGSEEIFSENIIPFKDRKIEALYVGSVKDAPRELVDDFSKIVCDFLHAHTDYTTEDAIEECFKGLSEEEMKKCFPVLAGKLDNKNADDATIKKLVEHYNFCDLMINSFYRKKLVEELVAGGIHVDVYGNGWDDLIAENSEYFHYKGLVPQEECIRQMQNTKFVLNSMPWFKDGTHDRIYNAFLAHSVCVTDPSKYMTENFQDGEDIVYYSLDHMKKLPQIIREYEADEEKCQRIIDNGYGKTALEHSWQARVITLLEHYFNSYA